MIKNGKYLNCLVCGVEFYRNLTRLKKESNKYCSYKCYWQNKKGKTLIGIDYSKRVPWNKGKKYLQIRGVNHPKWKGKRVSYRNLHRWVERYMGKPHKCEICKTTKNREYEWANKSHEYKRELSDWLRLCIPCHKRYDNKIITI